MVNLVKSDRIKEAIKLYNDNDARTTKQDYISEEVPFVSHNELSRLSKELLKTYSHDNHVSRFRLYTLLRGSEVYIAPKPPKAEPTQEFKDLMARLRREQEEREYQKLFPDETRLEPESIHTIIQKTSSQMSAVINILFSVVFTALAVWYATYWWSNLGVRILLCLMTAIVVALAETVLYARYLERVGTASDEAVQLVEKKSIVKVWESGIGKQDWLEKVPTT